MAIFIVIVLHGEVLEIVGVLVDIPSLSPTRNTETEIPPIIAVTALVATVRILDGVYIEKVVAEILRMSL